MPLMQLLAKVRILDALLVAQLMIHFVNITNPSVIVTPFAYLVSQHDLNSHFSIAGHFTASRVSRSRSRFVAPSSREATAPDSLCIVNYIMKTLDAR
jgi:hypothetical protein